MSCKLLRSEVGDGIGTSRQGQETREGAIGSTFMKSIFRVASLAGCILLAVSLVTTAQADPVADFWTTVRRGDDGVLGNEDDIAVGSTIRVVFVTSAAIDGNGTTQSYYDLFGSDSASTGSITGGLTTNWQSLVSTTETVSRENADSIGLTIDETPVAEWLGPEGSNVPVFNTNGDRVGDDGAAMLSGLYSGNLVSYDESGDDQTAGGSTAIWTGTDSAGSPLTHTDSQNFEFDLTLGSLSFSDQKDSSGDVTVAGIGDAGSDSEWLASAVTLRESGVSLPDASSESQQTIGRPIYVMSGEVTVVPEPSTVLLWLGCSGLAGLIYWRKRRRG